MMTDLAGFSRTVREFGIIHFLQTIYEHKQLVFPTFAAGQFAGDDAELVAGGTRALNRAMADFCADDDRLIGVASITNTGAMSSFSSYGANTVDICAPGSAVMSTVPKSSKGKVISGYASYSGTSMATPHVSGAAALYKSLNPSATHTQVKNAILGSAVATPSCNGKVTSNGRLNVSGY